MQIVTGATGRLGSYLVKSLLYEKKKVKVLLRNKREKPPKGTIAHYGDITRPETLEGLISQKDTVFHLAGLIDEASTDSAFYHVNVIGTENLLRACKGMSVQRFVFVSSISVFGQPDVLPADENTPQNPISKYGKSKMLAEEVVIRHWKKIPSAIVRPGMIYGPGFDEGYLPVLKMLEKRRMPVIGDGENHIPLVHVSDVVGALLEAAENEDAARNHFIVAGPGHPTQSELFGAACKELGVGPPSFSIPLPLARAALPLLSLSGKGKFSQENLSQLTRDRWFDCSKIKKKLDFEPATPLSEGIKEMVDYYKRRKVIA